jgi:hypothetical protein
VQRHLKGGGSVFITSKNEQKLNLPKEKRQPKTKNTAWVTAFYFNHHPSEWHASKEQVKQIKGREVGQNS